MSGLPVRLSCFALLSLVVCSSGALSQDAAQNYDSAPPETVVVTGHRPPAENRRAIVDRFVVAHGSPSPKTSQMTRWMTPICPVVRNLPPGFNTFITARIKAIAASVGAPTKPRREPCRPNIEIIFTAKPQAIMDLLANDPSNLKNMLLGYHWIHNTEAVARVTAPIQAWYVTETSNSVRAFIDDPYHGTPPGTAGSRFGNNLQSRFNHILILANTDKIAGYPIGPIADYIAMLALSKAQTRDNCAEISSILDLMEPGCPQEDRPQSLTIADKAYLDGLYAIESREDGQLQRSSIAEHMMQSFQ